jgi:hypothetical protein
LAATVTALAFLFTRLFDTRFGWNIPSRASAIALGVSFFMRSAMYFQQFTSVLKNDYAAMRWLHLGNLVFAGILLITTCVWGDQFHWRRFLGIGWLFLYIEEPAWKLTLWPQSESLFQSQLQPLHDPVNPFLGGVLFFEAAVMLVLGFIWLLNRPGVLSPRPDNISAKVLAAWPLSYAVWAPTLALTPFEHARGGILVNMAWLAAWVVALLVFRRHFDLAHRSNKIWLGTCALLLALLGMGFAAQ